MAMSQRWDANLLSHSLEFNHKTIFSLAFVFNLDKHSNVWMFMRSLSGVIFPFRLRPFAQQTWLPFLREELASSVSSHAHDLLLDIQQRVSLPPLKPARPDYLTGSCVTIEKSLCILDHGSHQGAFQVSWEGQGDTLRALAWAGAGPGVRNTLCSCYKKAL